jgi:putative acetyltransferase
MVETNNIVIEPCNAKDIDVLYDFVISTIKKCYFDYYPAEAIEHFITYSNKEDILNDIEKHYVIVTKLNNKIIGTGTLLYSHIKRVFVSPLLQRKGIGQLIMSDLETKAFNNGYKLVELNSSLFAKRFYDSLGYKMFKIGKVNVENNEVLYFQRMAKALVHINVLYDVDFLSQTKSNIDHANQSWFQCDELVYAEYKNNTIQYGEMFGIIEDSKIDFYFTEKSIESVKSFGKRCIGISVNQNKKIILLNV